MAERIRFLLVILVIAVVGGSLAAVPQETAPPQSPSGDGLPDGAGKDATIKMCGTCHEARRAASLRLTRDGWVSVVEDMIKRGARGTDQEVTLVVDYLATHFLGEAARPINVNTAAQIDLESVIGLLRREASALIAYRDKNGPCKVLDDLKKVPGLDFKKIDAARDRIVCF